MQTGATRVDQALKIFLLWGPKWFRRVFVSENEKVRRDELVRRSEYSGKTMRSVDEVEAIQIGLNRV